ncbi:MBL fold metallo-hydrolase [Arthrobacter sp. Sa2CUA1]|uniref:MBL fold metallo-hydrolase n=1 Tax=Arthrobacter gallicola TaxID=2762225 RepID=A0ABR8UVU8_9MICC|nr:MBL fold metallo-hydrolase [Arthrobacter gallicola]MBD7996497.1 MBL fold metallo-hydrolase [Arthrobacter gallicola]
MKLGPQLHRIGNDIVAAYLVLTDEGITIIDAGLAGHWSDLQRELAAVGRPLSDVRGIVLTHGDTDHLGFAERLRLATGIPVYVHSADAARAKGQDKPKASAGRMRLGPTLSFLAYSLRKGGWRTKYLTDVVPVEDGDVLDLPGSPRIIALPGHSPGSVAVHVPAAGALFVGDALTTRHVLTGQVGPQPAPFTDDPAQALEVLDRVTGLQQVDWVLPGHGTPWNGQISGLAAAVRAQS